jgi:hypothetical protein
MAGEMMQHHLGQCEGVEATECRKQDEQEQEPKERQSGPRWPS